MSKSVTLTNRHIRARTRKRKRSQRTIQLTLIVTGLILVVASGYLLVANNQGPLANADYSPEDIAYDRPLHAVHEMDGSKLAEIAFLPKGGPQPKIAISNEFYDFGGIGPQDVVTVEFAIFNQGEAPLTISRAYTTCGCTTADFTATEIPPGKVSIMTLTLDAGFHDVAGQVVRRGVIIENNDPKNPEVEIWVQAAVARK